VRSRRLIADLLVHSQLFMAFSGACFVCAISLIFVGGFPAPTLLLASATGILAIHLIDSVHSASREDMISQPRRAKLYRAWRVPALVLSGLLLILTGMFLIVAGTQLWVLLCFGMLGLLAASYVFPLFSLFQREAGRLGSLKDLARLKPLSISFAWLVGAFLVALSQPHSEGQAPGAGVILSLILTAFPLLLLDSIWLDRRDRLADESYDRRTFAVRMSKGSFRVVCLSLYLVPIFGVLCSVTGLHGFIIGGMAGAFLMIVLEPDQIRSESLRVVLAGLWRVTSLLGLLLFLS
jgi:hypothetical protein